MISYLRKRIRSLYINNKYPELQSGKIINYDTIQHLNCMFNGIEDALSPFGYKENGYKGNIHELAQIFRNSQLGTWAIDSHTMDWLWNFLLETRPNNILEFGSGCSTCLFCAWMKKYNPKGRVISIEQSKQESLKTMARLSTHGISNNEQIIHMNVNKTGRFTINTKEITQQMNGEKIDMLFVDGPSGPIGCRENTLPDSMPLFAQTGHWFLHDSYRTGELNILKQWSTINGIEIQGILAHGNGLCLGRWCIK